MVIDAAEPAGRDLGGEQGDADADRDGQDDADERDDERAVDEPEDAELLAFGFQSVDEEVAEPYFRTRATPSGSC